MTRSTKQPDRFERTLKEIHDVSDMLKAEGQYDGKSRYLEIMAELLLFVDHSLGLLRSYLAILIGLLLGHLLGLLLKIV